ncbi:RILP-like protein 1 isoform X8 [Bos mutus]|uniref:RILP-like protein 1 isoform X8 n=1 Tax=Bos mutus TaxID=72004 RepID=UPI0038B64E71
MEEDRGSALAAESALEKNVAELTVMDVYDIASLVGHEFERVIDQHGCEAIARLMPKVVRVLEILEVLVSRHHVAPELDELRLELDRLRLERMDRIEKERKHQKELELVEDVWRGEAQDLLSQIAQLQEENKQLMTNLSHKDVSFSEEEFQKHEGMSERERQVMKKLKEVVDKQRDEIRAKDRELGLKNEDVEALQQQQTRLMKINHDLRHRVTVVEAQGKALIEQKVELEADLQTKEQEMGSLRAELGKLRERLQGELNQNGEEEPVGFSRGVAGSALSLWRTVEQGDDGSHGCQEPLAVIQARKNISISPERNSLRISSHSPSASPSLSNHSFTFCFCGFASSGHFVEMDSCTM